MELMISVAESAAAPLHSFPNGLSGWLRQSLSTENEEFWTLSLQIDLVDRSNLARLQ